MDATKLEAARELLADALQGVCDDDYPDTMDSVAVQLQDEFGFTAAEADKLVGW